MDICLYTRIPTDVYMQRQIHTNTIITHILTHTCIFNQIQVHNAHIQVHVYAKIHIYIVTQIHQKIDIPIKQNVHIHRNT